MPGLEITVTRSAGNDRAVLVIIDTDFEPTDDPGLRILVNDDEAYVGKAYDFGQHYRAESVRFFVDLDQIPYMEGRTT